jgi:hypothetical protein
MDNPDAPINLIHQADCIGIILKIIEKKSWEKLIMQTPVHTFMRSILYKTLELNLVPPTFKHDEPSVGKTILTDKLVNKLDYTFTIMNL